MLTAKHTIQEILNVAAIQAGSRVEQPDIKEYKGDKLSWRLQAVSAEEHEHILILEQPVIDIYAQDGQVIPIQSNVGEYDKQKGIVHLKDNVVVGYMDWTLQSETLDFYQEKDVLHIQEDFKMYKKGMVVTGKNMRIFKKTGKLSVQGGVHMEIEENK